MYFTYEQVDRIRLENHGNSENSYANISKETSTKFYNLAAVASTSFLVDLVYLKFRFVTFWDACTKKQGLDRFKLGSPVL